MNIVILMIIENLSGLIELIVIMGGIVLCVRIYVNSDADKQLEKARIYADRDIRTANIEASVDKYGFNEPVQTDDGVSGLINMALSNPQILQSLLSKGGGGAGLPASFQTNSDKVASSADGKK